MIDCTANAYVRSIPDRPGVAGVLIDTERDLLFTSDRAAARVSVYRRSAESLLAQVAVDPRPNGLALDTARHRLFSFDLDEPRARTEGDRDEDEAELFWAAIYNSSPSL